MSHYVDQYCERVAPGLWSEPLNALTNLAIFVTAILAWRLVARQQRLSPGTAGLIALLFAIAIGSGMFHTFATTWAEALDVLPILIFQILFLWIYSRRVIGLGMLPAGAVMLLFFGLVWLAGQFPHRLNGSIAYAPALVSVGIMGVYHYRSGKRAPFSLLQAMALFCAALFFRSIDQAICSSLPIGTHFLWHLLNAGVLYQSTRGLVLNLPSPVRSGNLALS